MKLNELSKFSNKILDIASNSDLNLEFLDYFKNLKKSSVVHGIRILEHFERMIHDSAFMSKILEKEMGC